MLHLDYTWDLDEHGILLDEELNVDKLGWKGGDIFKLVNINGRCRLVKLDPVEAFSKGHRVNCNEQATRLV